jgi:regulator of microtubule dynamics protein 3
MFHTLVAVSLLWAGVAGAQPLRESLARGDSAYAAMDAAAALQHYEAAVALEPSSYEALWKASRGAGDLAEFSSDKVRRTELLRGGEQYARRAIGARPADAEGHFALARALGMSAMTVGIRERVKFAMDVRTEALEALRLDPQHAGAMHVLGAWHAEVMRLNSVERLVARNLLGGAAMKMASWAQAIDFMSRSAAIEPQRLVHHLDLARIYVDTGDRTKAREAYQRVIAGQPRYPNDTEFQRAAERELARLKK